MRGFKKPMRGLTTAFKQDLADINDPFYREVVASGRAAALDAHAREDNPYPKKSRFHRIWLQGFDGAQSEIESINKKFSGPNH
jgi:hypothetical protein